MYCIAVEWQNFFLIEQTQLKKIKHKNKQKIKKKPQTHLYGITVVTLPIQQTVDT